MTQKNRIAGGLIDRKSALTFRFNGKSYPAFAGDTTGLSPQAPVRMLAKADFSAVSMVRFHLYFTRTQSVAYWH